MCLELHALQRNLCRLQNGNLHGRLLQRRLLPRAGRGLRKANGCKCDGSCCAKGQCAGKSHETTSYEETLDAPPMISARPVTSGHRFSVGFGFGSGCPGLHFVGPIVWFNKGDEPRCAGCESQHEVADSDDGHDGNANEMIPMFPPAPADPLAPNFRFLVSRTATASFSTALRPRKAGPRTLFVSCNPSRPPKCSKDPKNVRNPAFAPRAARTAAPSWPRAATKCPPRPTLPAVAKNAKTLNRLRAPSRRPC